MALRDCNRTYQRRNKPPKVGGLPSTVAASDSTAAAGEPSATPLPRYPLRSNSQSSLLLHSPLRSPHRTCPCHNTWVPNVIGCWCGFGGLCLGVAAGVEEICWANKSRGEHSNKKQGLCFWGTADNNMLQHRSFFIWAVLLWWLNQFICLVKLIIEQSNQASRSEETS